MKALAGPKREKRLEYCIGVLAVVILLLLALIVVLAQLLMRASGSAAQANADTGVNVSIYFENLTRGEEALSRSMVLGLNPLYLKGQRSITFTRNVTSKWDHYSVTPLNYSKGTLWGFNHDRGTIFILYTGTPQQMNETLCHEVLHTYFVSNDISHDVIRDLASKGVCYS